MNTTSMYVINAILVLLVVRQIRERRVDLRGLAVPVLAAGAAAALFLHSVPGRGNDIPLELLRVSAGALGVTLLGSLLASSGSAGHSPNLHVALSVAAAGYVLAIALAWIAIRPAGSPAA